MVKVSNRRLTSADFEAELERMFELAGREGRSCLDVRSGDVHHEVGRYPGPDLTIEYRCAVGRRSG